MIDPIQIVQLSADFDRWQELLDLIASAFAHMDGVIDPPSSAKLLTVESLAAKARAETCFIATCAADIVGCIFIAERPDCLYVGKLAIAKGLQGRGLGTALVRQAEQLAATRGKPALELQTRVELTANQAAFTRMGFRATAFTTHAGYDRPTSITMRKAL